MADLSWNLLPAPCGSVSQSSNKNITRAAIWGQCLDNSLGCPYPYWVGILALPLIQLPANAHPRRQQVSASHVGDSGGILCVRHQLIPALDVIYEHLESSPTEGQSLSLSLSLISNKIEKILETFF